MPPVTRDSAARGGDSSQRDTPVEESGTQNVGVGSSVCIKEEEAPFTEDWEGGEFVNKRWKELERLKEPSWR